jgi:hypothetical protein|nr:MAG TPA: hypothetical protein [Caudoviricetes sp.]
MADVYTDIDNTLDVEVNFDNAPQDISVEEQATDGIQVGAQPEQLLSLIGANERLAATNARLADEILPTLRGGLQTKEVAPADIEQVVTPDDGYLGLQRVKVAPYEREVQVVNRRTNESEFLYYMEDIAAQYQRSDYAVCMAGEFYKNADTTILAGADAYLTSDGDFYDAGTTHTWHDDDDIHANRWVVYYFKQGENKSNFMIADATACPTVLAVKGHLGAIIANIAVSFEDIIVPDGSSILDIRRGSAWHSHPDSNVIKNILEHSANYMYYTTQIIKQLILGVRSVTGGTVVKHYVSNPGMFFFPELTSLTGGLLVEGPITTIYVPNLTEMNGGCIANGNMCHNISLPNLRVLSGTIYSSFNSMYVGKIELPRLETIQGGIITQFYGNSFCKGLKLLELPALKYCKATLCNAFDSSDVVISLPSIEQLSSLFYTVNNADSKPLKRLYLGCKGMRSQAIIVNFIGSNCDDIEIGNGALQPINISSATGLTRENIVNHILVKLGDNTGQSALTLTLGATNLAKLTDEDKAIATAKNWTLA